MNIIDIIEKKKKSDELSYEELQYVVMGYVEGKIPDYQMSALLMAITLKGMSKIEIFHLTDIMIQSGETLDLSGIEGYKVDKHSTGGVGDKTTLAVLPIVASCGVKCAKMSGKGLGFTGGTIDKLESIPGFQTNLEFDQFIDQVNSIGLALMSQTGNLCPADKKIYALRDVTGTTDSIPLIASSIISKKIASGANKIVLDVTCGFGAFMKNINDARELSKTMIEIGNLANRETVCVITNMNEPLGFAVGNSLEIIEAIEFLQGKMPEDLKQVVLELGAYMVKLAGKGSNIEENKKMLLENIQNGKAYNKFIELVQNQGGDIEYVKDVTKFEKAKIIQEVISTTEGYVQEINAEEIGKLSCDLGAGRKTKKDKIDLQVGIILNKKIGDFVNRGEKLATIYANDIEKAKNAENELLKIYKIGQEKIEENTIIDIIE